MTSVERQLVAPRGSTERGLVLINPSSGPADDTDVATLATHLPDADVAKCDPRRLAAEVRDARKDGRPFVGIAGGDGSIRTAAAELAHGDTALLPIPAGTHNHFAIALGVTDVDAAVAATHGTTLAIDLGRVNDHCFVNNSSIGFYPGVVQERERKNRRLPKTLATIVATLAHLRDGRRITVIIDRRPVAAWCVFVGNNCYGEQITDLGSRDAIDNHILDVRIVRADHHFARVRLLVAAVLGRLARSPIVERRTCREITIDVHQRASVDVALDGEVERLATPLRYESDANALNVLVP